MGPTGRLSPPSVANFAAKIYSSHNNIVDQRKWDGSRMKLSIKNFPLRLLSGQRLHSERLQAFMNDEGNKQHFDENFIKALSDRKAEKEKVYWRVTVANLSMLMILFLALIFPNSDMTLFGVSSKNIERGKEFIVFLSSTITVIGSMMYVDIRFARLILDIVTQNKTGDAFPYCRARYADLSGSYPKGTAPIDDLMVRSKYQGVFGTFVFVSMIIYMASLIMFAAFTHIYILFDLWRNSNFTGSVRYILITYCIACDFIYAFIMYEWYTGLPYRDYSKAKPLLELANRLKSPQRPNNQE
jgi:hypothetical protein